jgi:hypothetical protein
VLDGKQHTVTRKLEEISSIARPGSGFTLQIVPGSTVYDVQRTAGAVDFSKLRIELPAVDPTKTPPGYGSAPPRASLRIVKSRFLKRSRGRNRLAVWVRTRRGRVRNVYVNVRGKRRRLVGRSRPRRTFAGTKRFVIKLKRRAPRHRYRLVAAGRRPDGSALKATAKVPRKAVRKKRRR